LEIYGDGSQTRDFIHAHDIANAIYLIITHDNSNHNPWGEVFQIATGRETAIIDLASMITKFANLTNQSITFAPAVKGEIKKQFLRYNKG